MSFFIPVRSIKLEAILREPRGNSPRAAVIICHPHPAYGGTMDNRVVYRAAKAAQSAGLAALRFNFRGAGASTGSYDEGIGEKEDVRAAINWLAYKYPELPLALAGFSFGAWVGLQVACEDTRIHSVIGLGLPLNVYDFDFLIENPKPAIFIVGTKDEYCAMDRLKRFERRLPATSSVIRVEAADHFFMRDLESVQAHIVRFFQQFRFKEAEG